MYFFFLLTICRRCEENNGQDDCHDQVQRHAAAPTHRYKGRRRRQAHSYRSTFVLRRFDGMYRQEAQLFRIACVRLYSHA